MAKSGGFVILFLALSLVIGDNCPSNPIYCGFGQKTCQTFIPGPDGCLPPPICYPTEVPSSIPGNGLCNNPCPMSCRDGELYCMGGEDFNGCRYGDFCLPPRGDNCTTFCPANCGAKEMYCPSPNNGDCPSPDTCMPKTTTITVQHECPNFCPVSCQPDEYPCPQSDGNGCPMAPLCIPMQTLDFNGEKRCPNSCPQKCGYDETYCPGLLGPDGCRSPDFCNKRQFGKDNRLCPGYCPSSCPSGMMPCSSNDFNGCPSPPICVPLTYSGSNNNSCPGFCPVSCPIGSMVCYGSLDENGCKGPDTCSQIKTGNNGFPCPTFCPLICSEGQVPCPTKIDSNGCENFPSCASDLSQCF